LILRARAAGILGDRRTEVASLAGLKVRGTAKMSQAWRARRNAMLKPLALEGELAEWRDELLEMPDREDD
jgi:hypothetical protein